MFILFFILCTIILVAWIITQDPLPSQTSREVIPDRKCVRPRFDVLYYNYPVKIAPGPTCNPTPKPTIKWHTLHTFSAYRVTAKQMSEEFGDLSNTSYYIQYIKRLSIKKIAAWILRLI